MDESTLMKMVDDGGAHLCGLLKRTLIVVPAEFFMLTHGKEVRRVSFLLDALKALFLMDFPKVGKVSFLVMSGYFLTFIIVK